MKIFISSIIILILFGFMTIHVFAQESVPTMINYQGFLTDQSGTALNGPYQITFALYSEPTGAESIVWDETHDAIIVENGLFNVLLGGLDTLVAEDLDGERYLGIRVAGEPEMTPRMLLASVAYSLRAEEANYAHVLSAPDNDPLEAVVVTNDGDVGINHSSPEAKLDVNGTMKVSGKFDFANAFGWTWMDAVASQENSAGWVTAVNETDKKGILLMVQATSGGFNENNEVRITIDGALWKAYIGSVHYVGNSGWLIVDDSEDENSGILTITPFKTFQSSLKVEIYNASSSHESHIRVNYLVQ